MPAFFTSPYRLALVFIFIVTVLVIQRHSRQVITSIDSDPYSRKPPSQIPTIFDAGSADRRVTAANDKSAKLQTSENVLHPELQVRPPVPPTDYMAGRITPVKKLTWAEQRVKIHKLIQWNTPTSKSHWPAFDAYATKSYDPNRWEGFEWEVDFYAEVGVRDVEKDFGVRPEPYLPYPDYNTATWKSQWKGEYVACEGPRGKTLNDSIEDMVFAYRAVPENFPHNTVGSAHILGLDPDVCFDRFNRYGPYGFGQSVDAGPTDWRTPEERPEWSSVWWGQLQDACLDKNKERFAPDARSPTSIMPQDTLPSAHENYQDRNADLAPEASEGSSLGKFHHRTALLVRAWEGYSYSDNDLHALRAMVMELSLLSGGEYSVFVLVNVKDLHADIYNDPQAYQDVLKRVVPRELRDIAILWNEEMCQKYYPEVGDWQVYWHQFMVLQWFSKTHPEFDYVWNWETDARYTGNHYHFLEQVATFARNMPRKNLWERSSRYYFPSYHGNFASFLADTDDAIAEARNSRGAEPVWGPAKYRADQETIGPDPPTTYDEDKFRWGVGEEADLITLQPIWDPVQTKWTMRNKIWNFVEGIRPHFTAADGLDENFNHPDFETIPRRAYINTLSRFSKKLLHAMHMENRAGRTMQAEMWPATVALQHGLKAAYTPHPIWADRKWPAWYLEATFNANNNESAAWSQRKDSVFNHDRESAFRGWSWYYASWFPRILYRRWLGWAAVDILGQVGGDRYEDAGIEHADFGHIGGNGRMCLPGMLMHPVKKVKQNDDGDTEITTPNEEDLAAVERINSEVDLILASRVQF